MYPETERIWRIVIEQRFVLSPACKIFYRRASSGMAG